MTMPSAARSADERTIIEMFGYMRPSGSVAESQFVERYLLPLGFQYDPHDNLVLQIGDDPRVLFSSHVDTVHTRSGRQKLYYDGQTLRLTEKSKRAGANCLGADDTAGIWLMLEMIKVGVEGVYVIHDAEESGCVGSAALARENPAFFDGIEIAIAFDRMGEGDIITHQSGYRTCSDKFAASLAGQLGGAYEACAWGSCTDTNEYRGIVPECTNISVGYQRQHTNAETQDVRFLIELRDRLLCLDWNALVVDREPSLYDEDDDDGRGWGHASPVPMLPGLSALCQRYPVAVADILHAFGVSEDEVREQIEDFYGVRLVDNGEDEEIQRFG